MNHKGTGLAGRILAATLMTTTALGGGLAIDGRAMAQETGYDIPAGSLGAALTAFGRQSGLQLAYDPALAAGKTSAGLRSTTAPDAALAALLRGTGLGFTFTAPGVVTITGPAAGAAIQDGAAPLGTIYLYGDRTATILGESRASVAVVTAEPEAAPAPATVRDAFSQMGNVSAGPSLESGFSIRGINSEGLVPGGADAPLASFYIDGVQQTVNAVRRGTRSFFDIDQLEVYRGPQSTLSGRAALAGAMYLRTNDPEFARSGQAMLSFGSDNARRAGFAFGDALGENLAYRISAEWSDKDSDINYPSLVDYPEYDDLTSDEYYTLRAKVLWLPTGSEATKVLFSYSHSYDSPVYREIAGPNWGAQLGLPPGMGPSYDERRGDLWIGLSPATMLAGFYLPIHAYMENRNTRVDSLGVEVTHDISDNLRLTAITGYSRSVTDRASINKGMAFDFLGTGIDSYTEGEFTQRTFSQEVRLNYEDDSLRWVAGIYAGRINNDAWRDGILPGLTATGGLYLYSQQTRNTVDISNVALFGEADWEFSPGWSLIAGGRLDWFDQNQTGTTANYYLSPLPPEYEIYPAAYDTSFDDLVFLPKLGLEYQIDPGQSVSLVYQEGYRPGGAGAMVDGTVYEYDPEKTRNLELAWRGSFMDDRLTVGANVFWQSWKNQQVEVKVDTINSYIANAVKSESSGAEIDLAWAATDQLNLFASVGLLKTEFKDFNLADYGNFSGKPFPNAPERSIALGFRWTGDNGFFAAASAKYTGQASSMIEQGVSDPVKLKAYTLVDAEIGYAWDQARLTAYATNLFDKEYYTYESGPGVTANLGEGREVGLRLDYRF